jgi:hypothetical protein
MQAVAIFIAWPKEIPFMLRIFAAKNGWAAELNSRIVVQLKFESLILNNRK